MKTSASETQAVFSLSPKLGILGDIFTKHPVINTPGNGRSALKLWLSKQNFFLSPENSQKLQLLYFINV